MSMDSQGSYVSSTQCKDYKAEPPYLTFPMDLEAVLLMVLTPQPFRSTYKMAIYRSSWCSGPVYFCVVGITPCHMHPGFCGARLRHLRNVLSSTAVASPKTNASKLRRDAKGSWRRWGMRWSSGRVSFLLSVTRFSLTTTSSLPLEFEAKSGHTVSQLLL